MSARDVVITGIGLVSSLGEGTDAHWQKLSAPGVKPVVDEERYSPYVVHPMPEIDWSLQITKRGDQRQMENWQRLGTYAAGLALDDAGLKSDDALCSTMDMIVAAGGGERDEAVDSSHLDCSASRNDRDVLLNGKLTTELRADALSGPALQSAGGKHFHRPQGDGLFPYLYGRGRRRYLGG